MRADPASVPASARIPLALSLAAVLVAAGCSDAGKAETSDPPTAKGSGGARPSSAQPAGKYVREGWFGGGTSGLHARLEIKAVERQAAKSVVRYSVTSLDTAAKSVPMPMSVIDPVGREFYRAAAAAGGDQFAPGATRELVAEIPPLPPTVQQVTVLTPGTTGEFTGIPVTSGGAGGGSPQNTPGGVPGGVPGSGGSTGTGGSGAPAGYLAAAPNPSPSPSVSSSVSSAPSGMPTMPGTGSSPGMPVDLYDITEGEIKDVTSSGSDMTVNLRTDVLFASNSAKLSGNAKSVLDEAAKEIKEKADPTRRPLTLNGHTDSKGSDSYNLKLSRDRAEAVMKELKNRLGDSYKYSAHGKGEAELIAKEGGKDDAQARARNRRVEISYDVRQQTPGTSGTPTAPADGRGGTASPAPFRPQDGTKVASRYGRFGADKRRLDVKPFYRDGAYIVGVFDIVNEGPGQTPANATYAHKDYPGGIFTSFSILAPGGKDVFRAVRIGPATAGASASYVASGSAAYRTAVNEPVRVVVYMPAPPGNTTSVVFDGGPFGKVNNVPVS
ncbi:OmpA family protein [Actinomadura sp. NEAU-AAG7]|uniref:OmpA family protein n=1 Tax=Actinomadura sp. NEAU-AAG7 TaxID=2839640 RepID=UPI001BE3CF2D|nr:OmpA family protein [Actinomadura sp. NEAU-AAG7]MBT2206654.1 OmpA family protein [Actinomadura sp. NEAU-AAG7]